MDDTRKWWFRAAIRHAPENTLEDLYVIRHRSIQTETPDTIISGIDREGCLVCRAFTVLLNETNSVHCHIFLTEKLLIPLFTGKVANFTITLYLHMSTNYAFLDRGIRRRTRLAWRHGESTAGTCGVATSSTGSFASAAPRTSWCSSRRPSPAPTSFPRCCKSRRAPRSSTRRSTCARHRKTYSFTSHLNRCRRLSLTFDVALCLTSGVCWRLDQFVGTLGTRDTYVGCRAGEGGFPLEKVNTLPDVSDESIGVKIGRFSKLWAPRNTSREDITGNWIEKTSTVKYCHVRQHTNAASKS